ncbi:MAG: ATP-grasp domain-containing protein [Planctomycetota bacterium]
MTKNQTRPRLLLTCAGGSATIFFAKELRKVYDIFLADATDSIAAKMLKLPFARLPFGDHIDYVKALDRVVRSHRIDIIAPGADEELIPVRTYCDANGSVPFPILPTEAFINVCLDKKRLMEALAREGISTLLPFQRMTGVRYPAIAKPIRGRGSRQVHQLASPSQLRGYLALYGKVFNDVLVQPYITGDEYTVSVIVNSCNQLIGIVPKRVLVKRGITRLAVTEHQPDIERICHRIVEVFDPRGPFNVQLKLDAGRIYIFEINPRLSTTSVLTSKAFAHEIDLVYKYRNQEAVNFQRRMQSGWHLYRYDENVLYRKTP